MNDSIFIPKHVARLLLDGLINWENVESLVSLLTVASIREPVEEINGYARYIVKAEELKSRFRSSAQLDRFSFLFDNNSIPYIRDLIISKAPNRTIDYKVHELCNPKYHARRYKKNETFGVFPVSMWKMPRHVLIRWRYSSKLPVHKRNFSKPIRFENWPEVGISNQFIGDEIKNLEDAKQEFKCISRNFYYIMMACDESSVSYSFVCHVYFFAHDCLIKALKINKSDAGFFRFLKRLRICFEGISFLDTIPNSKIGKIESLIRGILPPSFYTKSPYTRYSAESFRAVRSD